MARDRVSEIDVRLRVKFSEISTGLDSLQDFKDKYIPEEIGV